MIKLTDTEGEAIWVNPALIESVRCNRNEIGTWDGSSSVPKLVEVASEVTTGKTIFYCKESPEQIAAMIETQNQIR